MDFKAKLDILVTSAVQETMDLQENLVYQGYQADEDHQDHQELDLENRRHQRFDWMVKTIFFTHLNPSTHSFQKSSREPNSKKKVHLDLSETKDQEVYLVKWDHQDHVEPWVNKD